MGELVYKRPDRLEEALDFLARYGKDTEVVAGATDVMVDLRAGDLDHKKYLLDISRLEALQGIEFKDGRLVIGACATLTDINQSGLVREHAPALAQCSEFFAARQIRNRATIGGNIAHASPCGDTIPPLVVHEALAVVASADGERTIPVDRIAAGPYQSGLLPDTLILRFILKPSFAGFNAFQKIGRRRELAVSRMSLAVLLDRDSQGRVSFIRVSLGACTPTPTRMNAVEDFLMGKVPDQDMVWQAGRLLSEKMVEITGRRSSTVYKAPAAQGLFMRLLCPVFEPGTGAASAQGE